MTFLLGNDMTLSCGNDSQEVSLFFICVINYSVIFKKLKQKYGDEKNENFINVNGNDFEWGVSFWRY